MKSFEESKKIPLAVCAVKTKVLLFSKIRQIQKKTEDQKEQITWQLIYNTSSDGETFIKRNNKVTILQNKKIINPEHVACMQVYAEEKVFYMTIGLTNAVGEVEVHTADSVDMKKWAVRETLPISADKRIIALPKKIYYSDKSILVKSLLKGLKSKKLWSAGEMIIHPRVDNFDAESLRIISMTKTEEGSVLLYDVESFPGSSVNLFVGAVILSVKDKIIWRSMHPLWQGRFEKAFHMTPIGSVLLKRKLIVFWKDIKDNIVSGSIAYPFTDRFTHTYTKVSGPLARFNGNPVITPRSDMHWEADGTFNPAAFQDDEGTVHLLYRAIGTDGISRVGYAQSKDGTHFTKRSAHPVFEPALAYDDMIKKSKATGMPRYNPSVYTSGGSWAGSEDPRAIKIRGRVYMTYVAFEGWESVRIALTSIAQEDLKEGIWKWRKPVLISPPQQVNKNWLLFPEKVHGKYAILHSIAPKVLIDYVDNLEQFDGKHFISSPRPEGPQPGRFGFWDNLLRGAGPPPLRTKAGWLLLYHAIDRRDYNRYKLGAMILDIKDPTKVLYRSDEPLLSPVMHYENDGKPGVIYASGAVIKDGKLFIYYGGGDRVVCVASALLDQLLEHIKNGKGPGFTFSRINIDP